MDEDQIARLAWNEHLRHGVSTDIIILGTRTESEVLIKQFNRDKLPFRFVHPVENSRSYDFYTKDSAVFVVTTNDIAFTEHEFAYGSIVIDLVGQISPQEGVKVIRTG